MDFTSSKESILSSIKNRLNKLPKFEDNATEPPNVISPSSENIDVLFAKNLKATGCEFIFCKDMFEFSKQLSSFIEERKWEDVWLTDKKILNLLDQLALEFPCSGHLKHCDVAITSCEAMIAETGSIVVSSEQDYGRLSSAYAPTHICVGFSHQVVENIDKFLYIAQKKFEKQKLSSVYTFITGPSKTADIEKTLVKGIHGPHHVYLFFIDNFNLS